MAELILDAIKNNNVTKVLHTINVWLIDVNTPIDPQDGHSRSAMYYTPGHFILGQQGVNPFTRPYSFPSQCIYLALRQGAVGMTAWLPRSPSLLGRRCVVPCRVRPFGASGAAEGVWPLESHHEAHCHLEDVLRRVVVAVP